MWLGYFSWAKKDFLRVHIPTIYYMQNKKGKKTFYANLLGRSHIISSNKLELPSKMLAYETYLICICAMAHATECITRGQFDDIGIFFRFKFEEYIPLVMIFDKNIKETFSTT